MKPEHIIAQIAKDDDVENVTMNLVLYNGFMPGSTDRKPIFVWDCNLPSMWPVALALAARNHPAVANLFGELVSKTAQTAAEQVGLDSENVAVTIRHLANGYFFFNDKDMLSMHVSPNWGAFAFELDIHDEKKADLFFAFFMVRFTMNQLELQPTLELLSSKGVFRDERGAAKDHLDILDPATLYHDQHPLAVLVRNWDPHCPIRIFFDDNPVLVTAHLFDRVNNKAFGRIHLLSRSSYKVEINGHVLASNCADCEEFCAAVLSVLKHGV